MSRKKLFIENIFAYGFINILNKIVPFLLLPIITRMLPNTSDFGVYSMYTTILGLGTPLAVLGLYDAMFREFFERDDIQYKYDVTTTTQRLVIVSSIVIAVILILFNRSFSIIFFGNSNYSTLVIFAGIGVFIGANKNPIQAPTRMQNQRNIFIISGLLSAISMYAIALILIYNGFSYFGLIYSSIISSFFILIFFWIRNNAYFLKGRFNIKIGKELLRVGLPLLPTFLIYWVYNSMDKIMITNILGTYELGVYSIGAKMAQVSQLIYAGFAGGWQYFSFSTMKDNDQVKLNSTVFEYLGAISVLSMVVVYPFIPIAFKILFEGDYILGYIVAPYLFLSPLLLMLFQIVANQFIIIKKSYLVTSSLSIGAVANIVLNFVLIPKMGVEGAAISTLTGYCITIIIAMLVSYQYKCMEYSKRVLLLLTIIPVYISIQRYALEDKTIGQFLVMLVMSLLLIYLYKQEFINEFRKRVRK